MPTCVSFLRGVNMAGHKSIKMTDLTLLYKELGFKDAVTYIQSGNVVFSVSGDADTSGIASKIESAILKKFNYNVPVMIRTVDELRKILSDNPFRNEVNFNASRIAVVFLPESPAEAQIGKVINIDYPPDKFLIKGREIFIYCPDGFGKSKLYTNFFEKKMGVTGTGRNLQTITALIKLAEKTDFQ